MKLTIVLRKDVVDLDQAQAIANIVKQKLEDYPSIEITATANESIDLE